MEARSSRERLLSNSDMKRTAKTQRARRNFRRSADFPGFATHHPGGMADNSPTFQRWDLKRQWVKVPKGRLKLCTQSAVPSGLIARQTAVPNVETLGYYRKSLRDKDLRK